MKGYLANALELLAASRYDASFVHIEYNGRRGATDRY
jgi:hypothetical protein